MGSINPVVDLRRRLVIGIGGLTSEVGKTTLMCELLQAFPEWGAIKTTRGHYRSCGKDPQPCCISHLLQDVADKQRASEFLSKKDPRKAYRDWPVFAPDQLIRLISLMREVKATAGMRRQTIGSLRASWPVA